MRALGDDAPRLQTHARVELPPFTRGGGGGGEAAAAAEALEALPGLRTAVDLLTQVRMRKGLVALSHST